jgi:hypothetical protein
LNWPAIEHRTLTPRPAITTHTRSVIDLIFTSHSQTWGRPRPLPDEFDSRLGA